MSVDHLLLWRGRHLAEKSGLTEAAAMSGLLIADPFFSGSSLRDAMRDPGELANWLLAMLKAVAYGGNGCDGIGLYKAAMFTISHVIDTLNTAFANTFGHGQAPATEAEQKQFETLKEATKLTVSFLARELDEACRASRLAAARKVIAALNASLSGVSDG